jgi:hypothetical protein
LTVSIYALRFGLPGSIGRNVTPRGCAEVSIAWPMGSIRRDDLSDPIVKGWSTAMKT